MNNQDDFIKDSSSILEDIENQLNLTLEKKRQEIEAELEEKINREKEEARQKISRVEQELKEDKQALQDYRVALSEFTVTKKEIKQKIQTHLSKASEYQTEIDSLSEKTLEELRAITDLHARLEQAGNDATEKIGDLKKDLQEKYGVTAELPDSSPGFSADFNLEEELDKLKKIKELLNLNGSQGDKYQITGEQPAAAENPEAGEKEEAEAAPVEEKEESETPEWSPDLKEMEPQAGEEPAGRDATGPFQEEPGDKMKEPIEQEHQTPEEKPAEEEEKNGVPFLNMLKKFTSGKNKVPAEIPETLEKFRKVEGGDEEGQVIYYENEGKAVLDGEHIFSVLEKCLQESGELYENIMKTESPKDQFFIKQKIIRQQEIARKFMLNYINVCEQKHCLFPEATREFFNADILKDILERVSMENWSNHEDFERFIVYIEDLAGKFRENMSSPEKFADTLLQDLT